MVKLSAGKRNALGGDKFALPAERKYPINDKSHAANAKSRASEMEAKGKISKGTEKKIDSKANKILKGTNK